MKIILLSLFCFCCTCRADDVRIVNGIKVNLQPIHDWIDGGKRGDRPLAHWKEFSIIGVTNRVATWQKCLVRIDGRKEVITLLVNNLDREIAAHFEHLAKTARDLDSLQAYIANEDSRVRRWSAVTPVAASGDSDYVDAVMAERARVNLAAARLADKKEELQSLREELSSLLQKQFTCFAMFSGRMYAGLPVWDCGRTQ